MVTTQQRNRLILWGAQSIRALRPHWVLQELELDFELRPIGSRTGETQEADFLTLNPRGKIPVLQDGDFTLAESAAIGTYLADTYGQGSGLTPTPGSRERALYDQWCFFIMTELDAYSIYLIRRHEKLADLYGEAPVAVDAARKYFAQQSAVASRELETRGPYLLGATFTYADILLTTCLTVKDSFNLPTTDVLDAYLARNTSREAFKRAEAGNRPPS
jgi:glutathione S-transferase